MQRVRLLGELGELFGEEHTYYNLRHPADAIKLLCINKPAFKDYLLKSEENGIGFKVIQADAEMGYEELLLPLGHHDLVVTPVLTGSGGGGVGKILAGVGLIAFSILTAGAGAGFLGLGAGLTAGTFTLGAAASVAIGSIGASLVLGGVAQLISPQPKIPQLGGFGDFANSRFGSRNRTNGPQSVTRGLDGQQSYGYTGAVNTIGVGQTVPLAYGKVLIGSHLLRSKVQVTDESDPLLSYIKKPGTDTMFVGGEKFTTSFSDVSGAVVRKLDPAAFVLKGSLDKETYVANGAMRLNPADAGKDSVNAFTEAFNSLREEFNVAFSFPDGLFSPVAGTGTTIVDSFVTYEVSVYRYLDIAPENLIAMDTVTVQGLLLWSNPFVYIHKMELPVINDNTVTVEAKILDSNAAQGCTLRMDYIGYNLKSIFE